MNSLISITNYMNIMLFASSMTKYLIDLLSNTFLVAVCLLMALSFLLIPTPAYEGLKNYRTSLKFLSLSYFIYAIATLLFLFVDAECLKIMIFLLSFSLQTVLFTFTLINLLNVHYIRKSKVLIFLLPTMVYALSAILFQCVLGYSLSSLNNGFLAFCFIQLAYCSFIFIKQSEDYRRRLDDYYADNYQLRMVWVRVFFFSAFAFGCVMALSGIFYSTITEILATILSIVFYAAFGFYYLQYPRYFQKIELLVTDLETESQGSLVKTPYAASWDTLKTKIIVEKIYLKEGVSINDMSQFLKIGRTSLSNLINKEEGMSFYSWINNLRIEEAIRLLNENPNYSISQLAELTGFSETSNFSRQFKSVTGYSPSVWKTVSKVS